MFRKKNQLCPSCKTGKESYELDRFSEDCPHIASYKNSKCPFYLPLENHVKKTSKQSLLLFFKIFSKNT